MFFHYSAVLFFILRAMGMGALHAIFKALSVVQCKQQDRHTAAALLYKTDQWHSWSASND